MKESCAAWRRRLDGNDDDDARAASRAHLASCEECREQEATDALLRRALASGGSSRDLEATSAVRESAVGGSLGAEVDARLDAWLALELRDRARGRRRKTPERSLRSSSTGRWVLGGYATAAGLSSLQVLSTISWPSISPAVPLAVLAAVGLLAPLVLFDRMGLLRPPG